MEWDDILKIVGGVIFSFGGIGGIIVIVIKFSANMIAQRMEEKYTLKLNKELEEYKSLLDNKTYISKARFDAEFDIYRSLSRDFANAVKDINVIIPVGYCSIPLDPEERKKRDYEIYNTAVQSNCAARNTLHSNIPFIPETFAEKYEEILKLCNLQIVSFNRRWSISFQGSYEEKSQFTDKEYERTDEINDKLKELNAEIREYLSKLDVVD